MVQVSTPSCSQSSLSPRQVINVDKNADTPKAIDEFKDKEELSFAGGATTEQVFKQSSPYKIIDLLKDWSNRGWEMCHSTQHRRSIKGYEAMNMVRKGRSSGSGERSRQRTGQIRESNSWSCSLTHSLATGFFCPSKLFATQPLDIVTGVNKCSLPPLHLPTSVLQPNPVVGFSPYPSYQFLQHNPFLFR